jgi:hypothetical protein
MGWAGHVAYMGLRNVYRILFRKLEGKSALLGRLFFVDERVI